MTSIVASELELGVIQADGRRVVVERHTASDGQTYLYDYLNDGIDPQAIMAARAERLNAQLAEQDAALAAVAGTTLPLSPYEFLKRFPTDKRIAIRAAAKTDVLIEDFMDLLNRAQAVYPGNDDVRAALQYLVSQNLLTADEAAAIGAA